MNQAIITAFTQDFWDDFIICYDSICRVSNVPIYVVPLDFDDEYENKLKALNVEILEFSEQPIKRMKKHFKDRWVQWSKPYIIKSTIEDIQEEYVLWLDVDIVVTDKIEPIFHKMTEDFVVVGDYFAPDTCLNDKRLYKEHNISIAEDKEEVALNSGVVGLHKHRDRYIIDIWIANTEKLIGNEYAKEYIALYDQGVLLWVMHELNITDKILQYDKWNARAKRNCYEYSTISNPLSIEPNFKWPIPDMPRMGGDTIDEVKLDNPGVIIAHFAGYPKLSQLCKINNEFSKTYIMHQRRNGSRDRLFCVGLERAGTHTIAETIRRSAIDESWVRHEFAPVLAKEVKMKLSGEDYWTQNLSERMVIYNRSDTLMLCESNHRLGFFIPEISHEVHNAKFILMLREPIALMRSRLRNYCIWNEHINTYDEIYLDGLKTISPLFTNGSTEQNAYRITDGRERPLLDMHRWEIITTLETILNDLSEIDKSNIGIVWIDNLSDHSDEILKLSRKGIDPTSFRQHSQMQFGQSLKLPEAVDAWIDEQIGKYGCDYVDEFIDILRKHKIKLPFNYI